MLFNHDAKVLKIHNQNTVLTRKIGLHPTNLALGIKITYGSLCRTCLVNLDLWIMIEDHFVICLK